MSSPLGKDSMETTVLAEDTNASDHETEAEEETLWLEGLVPKSFTKKLHLDTPPSDSNVYPLFQPPAPLPKRTNSREVPPPVYRDGKRIPVLGVMSVKEEFPSRFSLTLRSGKRGREPTDEELDISGEDKEMDEIDVENMATATPTQASRKAECLKLLEKWAKEDKFYGLWRNFTDYTGPFIAHPVKCSMNLLTAFAVASRHMGQREFGLLLADYMQGQELTRYSPKDVKKVIVRRMGRAYRVLAEEAFP